MIKHQFVNNVNKKDIYICNGGSVCNLERIYIEAVGNFVYEEHNKNVKENNLIKKTFLGVRLNDNLF